MGLTGTVHPPAGATALMAVLDDDVARLGWFLLAPVMLGCGLMLCVALLVNNIQRRFPYYWWSPEEMGARWKRSTREKTVVDEGKDEDLGDSTSSKDSGAWLKVGGVGAKSESELASSSRSGAEEGREIDEDIETAPIPPTVEFTGEETLVVSRGHVKIPRDMYLTFEEKLVLETLSQRL